jgi:hypothetical protein
MNADEMLHKRRIVRVLDYFDEEGYPWNYIQRSGDGRFEAVATHLTEDAAAKALSVYLHMVYLAECEDDDTVPTVH